MKNFYVISDSSPVIPAKAGIHNRINKAQSTIEFTFAVIVVMFLIYGMVQVFRWAGMDLAQRRYLQDTSITTNPAGGDPSAQLTAGTDIAQPLAAVYHGSITNASQ